MQLKRALTTRSARHLDLPARDYFSAGQTLPLVVEGMPLAELIKASQDVEFIFGQKFDSLLNGLSIEPRVFFDNRPVGATANRSKPYKLFLRSRRVSYRRTAKHFPPSDIAALGMPSDGLGAAD